MHTEQRQSPRKVFKTRAMLAAAGAAPVLGRTSDISASGVSLTMPQPVPVGQMVQVRFDMLVEGAVVPVNTRGKTLYCILSSGEFKVGLQFLSLELGVMTAIARFMR
ncbi:PilZ domain-containing protein [Massilia niabensis]|uniref:PilZ domain-containing protein n=1 Tax=Massilia niabensis TaxID=544910 RepID=A0ABW0L0R7_9BURK